MSRLIFVNLPVKDVAASTAFFTRLGFSFNPRFSDDRTLCMVIADNIFVMLLEEGFFRTFINGDVSDAHQTTEVLTSLSASSKEEVQELVRKALDAGAKPWQEPVAHGVMYYHSFQDPDGHVWEIMHMDSAEEQ